MTKGLRFYCFGFGFLLALWLLHQQAELSLWVVYASWGALVGCVGLVVFAHSQAAKGLSPFVLFCIYTALGAALAAANANTQIYQRLAQQLPIEEDNRIFRLQLQVLTMPQVHARSMQFTARVVAARPNQVPKTILVRWFAPDWSGPYREAKPYTFPEVLPGQLWQLTAVLRTPHGAQNPAAFDYEEYTFAQGIRAVATVRDSPQLLAADSGAKKNIKGLWHEAEWQVAGLGSGHSLLLRAQSWRTQLKEAMEPYLGNSRWGKIILALSIGDRSAFTDEDWLLFNRSGLTHLISISGTHITLVAGSVGLLFLALLRRLYWRGQAPVQWQPGALWAGGAALLVAALYSAIAGWGVPARRSFFMLAFVVLGYAARLSISAGQLLLMAAIGVLMVDPWAMLSTGFWLSFGAVAVLLACVGWSGVPIYAAGARKVDRRWFGLRCFVLWQAIITILLWPLLVWFFAEFSVASVVTNLYAITLLGTFATPLSLLFALSAWLGGPPWLTEGLMQAALWLIEGTMRPTEWVVSGSWAALAATRPPAWVVGMSVVGLCIALMPRFWSGQKWFWLAVLPVLFWPANDLREGEWRMHVLDVGQGLGVVIQSRHHTYVYDMGRRSSPTQDEGRRSILPFLKTLGVKKVDAAIISHADLDHIGGLRSLISEQAVHSYYSSFPLQQWWAQENRRLGQELQPLQADFELYDCVQGKEWSVDGVRFRFLWPVAPLSDIGANSAERNAASCVLEIQGAYDRALLTGDITTLEEQQLYDQGLLRSQTLVVAPHHGSRCGSSEWLTQSTQPCFAVAAAGWWNRFNHPHPDTIARWEQAGALFLSTLQWGALRFESRCNDWQWYAQRWHGRRYWHHPGSIELDSGLKKRVAAFDSQQCRQSLDD